METKTETAPITLSQGWHVLHLFYRIDRVRWTESSPAQRTQSQEAFCALVERVHRPKETFLYTYAMVGTKADLGVFLLIPDLQQATVIQHELTGVFPAGVLQPVFSFFSITELSEYTTTEEEFQRELVEQEKLDPGSQTFQARLEEWRARMAKYRKDRLNPVLPSRRVMAFYPMSKRRGETRNWYLLPFETRKQLMGGHQRVGRKFAGRVVQLITGATGLDDWEWGVTLLADTVEPIKQIVYEMRFDEVSAAYGLFGPFFVGIRLKPAELCRRLAL